MAVSTTNAISGPFTTNGVTTAFPFTFTAPSTDEVAVLIDGVEASASGYTVTLTDGGGGTVTFDTAPASGSTLYVLLEPDFTQDVEFSQGTPYLASAVNAANDRAASRDQWLKARVDTISSDALMVPATRAGYFLAWDASGNPYGASGTGADEGLRTDAADPAGSALIGFLQSGTGAVARTMLAKGRDVLNVADFLPVGYVADGSVDYTTEIQAAIDEAVTSKRALVFPNGTFKVSGTGLSVSLSSGINLNIVGQGFANTIIRNSNGNVLRCQGQYLNLRDIQLVSAGGGHTIVQTGLLALCAWENVYLAQEADGYSVWDNAGHEFVENWFAYSVFGHKTTGTVYPFNLVGVGGIINNNSWFRCRADRCGTKHFFNVETTTANAQYANSWVGINFEVCLGGGIRLRGVNGFVIEDCQNWDAGAGAIVNDFYDLDAASGIGCVGKISDCGRWAGSMTAGKYDAKLPGGGGGNGIVIENCRSAGGGDPFTIDAANNGIFVSRVSSGITSVINTAGLIMLGIASSSIDVPAEYRVLGTKVVGARQTAVGDAVNAAAAPTQAEFNALVAKFNLLLDKLGTAGHGLTAD